MAFGLSLPWTRTSHTRPRQTRAPAAKNWLPGAIAALSGDAGASWSGRSYAAIAREGFMRNPVAHRATRMIAEAAASVPWVVFDEGREQERHPIKDLLMRPDPNGAGDGFSKRSTGTSCSRAMAGSTRSWPPAASPGCSFSGPTGCG
ncbi:MAG: hypothetical protein HoeaKO_37170 [Hoeflea alexandrii]